MQTIASETVEQALTLAVVLTRLRGAIVNGRFASNAHVAGRACACVAQRQRVGRAIAVVVAGRALTEVDQVVAIHALIRQRTQASIQAVLQVLASASVSARCTIAGHHLLLAIRALVARQTRAHIRVDQTCTRGTILARY